MLREKLHRVQFMQYYIHLENESNFTSCLRRRAFRIENFHSFHFHFLAKIPRYYNFAFSLVCSICRLVFFLVCSVSFGRFFYRLNVKICYVWYDTIQLRRKKIRLAFECWLKRLTDFFCLCVYFSFPLSHLFDCLSLSFTTNWHQNV